MAKMPFKEKPRNIFNRNSIKRNSKHNVVNWYANKVSDSFKMWRQRNGAQHKTKVKEEKYSKVERNTREVVRSGSAGCDQVLAHRWILKSESSSSTSG